MWQDVNTDCSNSVQQTEGTVATLSSLRLLQGQFITNKPPNYFDIPSFLLLIELCIYMNIYT